jgi:inosine-uridine nucleoside N-ribohydrolase
MSERYPEWRFGQMVANVSFWAKGPTTQAIWDVEDQQFLEAITKHLQKEPPTA